MSRLEALKQSILDLDGRINRLIDSTSFLDDYSPITSLMNQRGVLIEMLKQAIGLSAYADWRLNPTGLPLPGPTPPPSSPIPPAPSNPIPPTPSKIETDMASTPSVSASLHFKDPDVVLTIDIHTARWLQNLCSAALGGETFDLRAARLALYEALKSATSDIPDF